MKTASSHLSVANGRILTLPPERGLSCLHGLRCRFSSRAFTLLEVMIACGIFFIAVFAILALVSNTLRNARVLRHIEVDAGMAAAELFKTNLVFEGSETGDFGDTYPEYSWERFYTPAESNGLWQVDIIVRRRRAPKPVDNMSIL